MLAYLKVVDKYPADFTFCRFWGPIQWTPQPLSRLLTARSRNQCKFGVILCKSTSQYGPEGLDMPLRESPNHVYELTITNSWY